MPRVSEIQLTQGQFALIDEEDFERLSKFSWIASFTPLMNGFYAKRWNGIYMHREVMGVDGKLVVDHVNHNILDNRKSNLRVITHQQNMFNRKLHRNNSSGVAGVSFVPRRNSWEVRISIDGKETFLGSRKEKTDAIQLRLEAEKKHYGEFAFMGGR
jgi:hypothetical protein